ncbi:hypothetical protein DFJ77DRAFT_455768 [Powellomyces hirtus]|nr:hypothetical protein DFJ77DRAFT_455768 [Powellomyces hirtus]
MFFSIFIPSRFLPRSQRRNQKGDSNKVHAETKAGRYIREIVADLVATAQSDTSVPTICTTPAETLNGNSPSEEGTSELGPTEEQQQRLSTQDLPPRQPRGRSRSAYDSSSFLSVPSGDNQPPQWTGSPRSESRSSTRSSSSITRSFLAQFAVRRRLSASASVTSLSQTLTQTPSPSVSPASSSASRRNPRPAPPSSRPRPRSTSDIPTHPSATFDYTPTYTPTAPLEPLEDFLPPAYHSFTEGPHGYTVVAEIPNGMPLHEAFQVYVYDDDREVAFAASTAQMGVRIKMPMEADLSSVTASVCGERLTITIAKHDFAI